VLAAGVNPLPIRPTPVAVCCCPVLLQVSGEREFFAQMVVDAVTALDLSTLDLKMVGMKKVRAGPWPPRGCRQGVELSSSCAQQPVCVVSVLGGQGLLRCRHC
jgi:hypothetical protein